MSEDRKNIERLFQERFKDFEVTPREGVWKNIKNDLEGRAVAPKWLLGGMRKWIGIAASILVLLGIGSFLIWQPGSQTEVTLEDYVLPLEDFITEPLPTETFTSDERILEEGIEESLESETILSRDTEAVAVQNMQTQPISTQDHQSENTHTSRRAHSGRWAEEMEFHPNENASELFVLTENETTEDFVDKKLDNQKDEEYFTEIPMEIMSSLQESFAQRKKAEAIKTEEKNLDQNTKSIWDDIAKNEEEDADKSKKKEWMESMAIRPNVAPVYYNSFSGGSGVDPELANHKSHGDVTASYGLNFSYAVSKKMRIRTGVSKVNMSYHTEDLAFATTSSPHNGLKGVGNNPQAAQIVVINKGNQQSLLPPSYHGNMADPYTYGNLNQQLEYIEIPLEMEWALLDKKFGINLIGGASTLFLHDDAVEIHSELGVTDLGRANNLNSVSFTTNVGLGFEYNFTNRLNLNLEPSFKYQLSGYSGETNGFRPYYIALYSGISYKF